MEPSWLSWLNCLLLLLVMTTQSAMEIDMSRVYIFWNEEVFLDSILLHRFACSDWHNFTFLVSETIYNQTMSVNCGSSVGSSAELSRALDVGGQPILSPNALSSSSPRQLANYRKITPLLFEDETWLRFTEADIFIGTMYEAFYPHEHIDSMMNHIVQSSIFAIAWSKYRFYDFQGSSNSHERKFLLMMSNIVPAHERPKLMELPVSMEDFLSNTTAGHACVNLLDLMYRQWSTTPPASIKYKKCTGWPLPSGTEFVCDEDSARAYTPKVDSSLPTDDDVLPHFNSWGIERLFDSKTSLVVKSVASAAHLQYIAGLLPDPVHGPVETDPHCVHSNMTEIDRKVAFSTVVADPTVWQSTTALAALEGAHSNVNNHNNQNNSSSNSSNYNLNHLDDSNHVINPYNRTDPRYRERILCLTYTIQGWFGAPGREDTGRIRAIEYVRSTWGKRCDGYLAISNVTDHSMSTIHVEPNRPNWSEKYDEMWVKAQLMWKLVGSMLLDDYDYFLIGGDDLYVIVENLRVFLARPDIRTLGGADGRKPVYLGRVLNQNQYIRFNTGGAGYLLNAAAAAALYRKMDDDECLPGVSTSMEDVLVGQCLRYAGIYPVVDTSDYEDMDTAKAQALAAAETANARNAADAADRASTENTVEAVEARRRRNDPRSVLDRISPIGKGRNLGREVFHPQSPNLSYWAAEEWYQAKAASYGVGDNCCSVNSVTYQDIRGGEMMSCFHAAIYEKKRVVGRYRAQPAASEAAANRRDPDSFTS